MKRIAFAGSLYLFSVSLNAQQAPADKNTKDSFYLLAPVEVRAVRAAENSPFSKTNLSKKEIEKNNLGQDIPFILNQTPSVVVTSDAGNGIGYTGIHIRGTDGTRINITLNGIPYNDAESQISYFVDLPDIASSVNSIQIQRGVGTSSNGAGAFGASINFSTNEINRDKYLELNNSYGSFSSQKTTLKAGSGLINGHFTADLRLSGITSDGYIDRAGSNLRSLYFSTAYTGNSSSLRFNIFSGKEKTYQAWYGVSETDLKAGKRRINYAGMEDPNGPYPNQTDNYTQTHYQLFFDHRINKQVIFNTALFYTKGKGYYEEYKAGQDYSNYNLPYPVRGSDTIRISDFIRRRWLNNDYYGNIFSIQYKDDKTLAVLGGGVTRYTGGHYGILAWASNGFTGPERYYNNNALKTDFNVYLKKQTMFADHWNYFLDIQFRHVKYNINGFESNPALLIKNKFDFFNPKAGISYIKNNWKGYFSYSLGRHEPNRDDFEANREQQPKPETLHDFEFGIEHTENIFSWGSTLYYMRYKDQLVLTGKINDIGAYTRTNIPNSYRAGIELQGGLKPCTWFRAAANLSLSRNKVLNFTEYIDDYDNGGQKVNNYHSTDIALSPSVISGATISFLPKKNLEFSLLSKYVGKQYLDNTEHNDRSAEPYFTEDIRAIYTFSYKWFRQADLVVRLNNIFNKKYESGGYTYNYISGGQLSVNNYYFPMAGTNFLLGVNIKF
ncbi:MAG: TonB-dependent receptor [Chitinophagaceae bacterium]|nr:TonB-dependent receptor [Chitinophagaceae bacterium]